jgi:hypothetical protein
MSNLEASMFLGVCFCIPVIFIWLYHKEKDFFKIYFSARRMGLRDKGIVQPKYLDDIHQTVCVCLSCQTAVRIGVQKNNDSVHYCWRCETIFLDDDSGGDDSSSNKGNTPDISPNEDVPIPEEVVKASEKVLQRFTNSSSV